MINPVYPTIISNAVTAGNLLADTTTANAFIAPVGIDFSRYRGDFIEIYSGTTLWAQAWVSESAPGGESLDSEFIGSWESVAGYVYGTLTVNANGHDIDALINTAPNRGQCVSNQNHVPSTLHKIVCNLTLYSGVAPALRDGITIGSSAYIAVSIPSGASTKYYTFRETYTRLLLSNTEVGVNENVNASLPISDKRVLDPAPTGALLLSTKGGSRGWAYKHASFNPNAAVTLRILARRIASGNGGYYK